MSVHDACWSAQKADTANSNAAAGRKESVNGGAFCTGEA
jgi:hypothetical protein